MKIIKIILITILLSITCVGFIWTIKQKKSDSNEVCQKLNVDIKPLADKTNYVTEDMIVKFLNINGLNPEKKQNPDSYSYKIRDLIENNFAVKKAECYFNTKNKIFYVNITQRTPFFKVVGNRTYYVEDNDKRNIFTTVADYNADVPIVTGIFTDSIAQKDIFDFVKFLKNDKFLSKNIKNIYITNGFVKLTTPDKKQTIILGKLKDRSSDYKTKLERFKKFSEKVDDWKNFTEIDLRFDKQVVCK